MKSTQLHQKVWKYFTICSSRRFSFSGKVKKETNTTDNTISFNRWKDTYYNFHVGYSICHKFESFFEYKPDIWTDV